jgi:Protein of unknown function (DUF3891)
MIIRRVDADLLLIAQDDHAALAGQIMAAWRAGGLPEHERRDRVLEATGRHDLGWRSVDAAPSIHPESGTPYEFLNAPLEVRQGVWSRALTELAPQDPYVAALVAHHATAVYRRFASTSGWEAFFPELTRRRDDLLATAGLSVDILLEDYTFVGMGDLWSLVFCNGWQEPHEREGYRAVLHDTTPRQHADAGVVHGGWLEITPDPFDGEAVPLAVPAWRVPSRRYSSDGDLRDTVARAPTVQLMGVAACAPTADRGATKGRS